MTDLTKPKTKSERIRELLQQGWSPEEVAKELETTREYVYKEKGKFKKKKILVTGQSLTIADGGNELTVIKGQPIDNHSNTSLSLPEDQPYGIGDYDIRPLQMDDLKSMYSCFEEKMDPSQVVAQHGFRPDISEREHLRFLSIKSRDPFEFQKSLISGLEGAPPEIQSIIDKACKGILLNNNDLLSIISFKMRDYALKYLQEAISNPTIFAPGLSRIKCRFCQFDQPGVLFDVNSHFGKFVNNVSAIVCSVCGRIKNEAFEEYQRTPR